jgi:hypothetical protein
MLAPISVRKPLPEWNFGPYMVRKAAPRRPLLSPKPAMWLDKSKSTIHVPLNFKVPHEFHRDFKTFAAQHGKKMVEVLQEAFALIKEKYGS